MRVLDNDIEPVEPIIVPYSQGWIQPFVWVERADYLPRSVLQIVAP